MNKCGPCYCKIVNYRAKLRESRGIEMDLKHIKNIVNNRIKQKCINNDCGFKPKTKFDYSDFEQ